MAFRENFVGPTIGQSRYLSTQELSDAVFTQYQGALDDAYAAVQRAESAGRLRFPSNISKNTYRGQLVDAAARDDMRAWLAQEGIDEGSNALAQVNRRLYSSSGSGYRIPDVRIPGSIFDATLGMKWDSTPQIQDFLKYSPGSKVTIVRPTVEGGSYSIVR